MGAHWQDESLASRLRSEMRRRRVIFIALSRRNGLEQMDATGAPAASAAHPLQALVRQFPLGPALSASASQGCVDA